MPPLSQDPDLGMPDEEMLAELENGVCTNPYCDYEAYLEWETENLLAGLPKSAGIQISTNVSFSPSIDFKREEEADLSDNAYDLPNTLEQPWQPIKRKLEEEPDLLSEWPSSLFALSDSEEHPGSPKASSCSPPINISKPKQASNHREGAPSLTWILKAPSL